MLKYYLLAIKVFETFLNIPIVIILNLRYVFNVSTIPQKNKSTIVVLGNGPSLKQDIDNIHANRNKSDIMVVNTFACTIFYEQVRPEYYIIIDPSFFNPVNENDIKIQNTTIDSLIRKTKWPLKLILPISSKSNCLITQLKCSNNYLNIHFVKNIPVIGGHENFNSLLFRLNLANPLFQNVLIAAIFLGIKMKYSQIKIWGADHSWHEDFVLGKDNHVYTPDKHFYDSGETFTSFMHIKSDGTPIKVHEEFYTLSRAFQIYHSIKNFAISQNCSVYNLSSKTWIDAFSRNIN